MSVEQLYRNIEPSVVQVRGNLGSGSAFAKGFIANAHGAENERELWLYSSDGRRAPAHIKSFDPKRDLTLLEFDLDVPDDAPDSATARVLELTNAERAKDGLAPLTLNPQLSQAAQRYSEVLASGACFAHTCGPVADLIARDAQAGYAGWTTVGENIAGGYPTPEAVMAGWMASPAHRENILWPAYQEIGIGLANGGQLGAYWTQEFGSRGDAPSALDEAPVVLGDADARDAQ
jgi:uncharacterized protein YkwD